MVTGEMSENAESRFSALLAGAARLPGVRVDREAYLRAALARHCSEDQLRRAMEETPRRRVSLLMFWTRWPMPPFATKPPR